MNKKLLFIAAWAASFFAAAPLSAVFAADGISVIDPIKGERCIKQAIQKVYDSIVQYDKYSEWDGKDLITALDMDVSKIEKIPDADLVKNVDAQSWVQIQMQPLNLKDKSLKPMFLLHCSTLWSKDRKTFTQNCHLVTRRTKNDGKSVRVPHFGIEKFDLLVTVSEGCKEDPGALKINYELKIETNTYQVRQIIDSASMLPSVVTEQFNMKSIQNDFFRDYFEKFYQNWLNTLN